MYYYVVVYIYLLASYLASSKDSELQLLQPRQNRSRIKNTLLSWLSCYSSSAVVVPTDVAKGEDGLDWITSRTVSVSVTVQEPSTLYSTANINIGSKPSVAASTNLFSFEAARRLKGKAEALATLVRVKNRGAQFTYAATTMVPSRYESASTRSDENESQDSAVLSSPLRKTRRAQRAIFINRTSSEESPQEGFSNLASLSRDDSMSLSGEFFDTR